MVSGFYVGVHSRYSKLHFVNLEALRASNLPLEASEFEVMVRKQCVDAKNILKTE